MTAVTDTMIIARRSFAHLRREPGELVGFLLFPIIMIVLFAYVFGSAISLPGGGNYGAFLMPGIFMQTMALTAVQAATRTNTDMTQGIIDRFRSMPIARAAVLTGTNLAEIALRLLGLAGMVLCALALTDWSPHHGVASTTAAFVLLAAFGLAMIWVGTFIGLSVSNPTVADQATFGWLFPMTFLANTFVPTQGLPAWLRPVADWNPMSATVAAVRALFGNPSPTPAHAAWPLQHPIPTSAAWSIALLLVFVPLSIWRYRKASR
ncbi:MAG TPA: ABC transporter permease [Dactylosporangium sp.]|jgi:ABC-type polysaccharide/polyol phosphate export permease|nr:ABC transporter permease [Dactylosporangium sp.]